MSNEAGDQVRARREHNRLRRFTQEETDLLEAVARGSPALASRIGSIREKMLRHMSDLPHGRNGYHYWECRCDVCRAAIAALRQKDLARVQKEGRQPPNHGTISSYYRYRCRCNECVAAHRAYDREYYHRKNSVAAKAARS